MSLRLNWLVLGFLSIMLSSSFFSGCGDDDKIDTNSNFETKSLGPLGNEVTLSIPAHTFPDDMSGTIEANDPAAAIDTSAFEAQVRAKPILHPIILNFSDVQGVTEDGQMEVRIEIPQNIIDDVQAARKKIYAFIKIDGDFMGPDEEASHNWHEVFGRLERDQVTGKVHLRLSLFASGITMTVVVSSGTGFTAVIAPESVKRSVGVFDLPWIIGCVGSFTNPKVCDTNPGVNSIGQRVQKLVTQDAAWLKGKGWIKAKYFSSHFSAINSLATSSGEPIVTDPALPTANARVHLALLKENLTCSGPAWGCYHPDTGVIEYDVKVVDPAIRSVTGAGDVILHELFHGVQNAYLGKLFSHREPVSGKDLMWIYEGTADAMGFWKIVNENRLSLMNARRMGTWRSWVASSPLNDNSNLTPYETFEFYSLLQDGSMSYLKPLFEKIGAFPNKDNSYATMNTALKAVVGNGLRALVIAEEGAVGLLYDQLMTESTLGLGLLRTIAHRKPQSGYPHCNQTFQFNPPAGNVQYSEGSFSLTAPMSSECTKVTVPGFRSKFGSACLKVTLSAAEEAGKFAMIVSGAPTHNAQRGAQRIAYAGQPLYVQGESFSVQIVDLDFTREKKAPGSLVGSEVMFEIDPNCGQTQEEQDSCLPTRTYCTEGACFLEMYGGYEDCWADIAMCNSAGCFVKEWGDWAPLDWGVCEATSTQMSQFTAPGDTVVSSAGLPDHRQCGTSEFCKRIILCGR